MIRICPVFRKAKSVDLCSAFAAGAPRDAAGSVFYGVEDSNAGEFAAAKAAGDWWYIDNSYFDSARQGYFRVTRNALQHSGLGESDGRRFDTLGVAIDPWRPVTREGHVVLCPQSDHFMQNVVGYRGDWQADALRDLLRVTDRPVRVRGWSSDKTRLASTLRDDLVGAHALVTWSSAAAVTAALAGVRSVSMGQSAAAPVGGTVDGIERLPTPQRLPWAGVLADNQFTVGEMGDGTAWKMLNSRG